MLWCSDGLSLERTHRLAKVVAMVAVDRLVSNPNLTRSSALKRYWEVPC